MSTILSETIPALPLDALREAMGRADLDATCGLLDAHERAVHAALHAPDELRDPRQTQAWMNLIADQQALLQELSLLREQAAGNLRQLQRHRSGANAYARAMG